MWKGGGIEVFDLGVNVPPRSSSRRRGSTMPTSSACALLTTTMPNMRAVVEAVRAAGCAPGRHGRGPGDPRVRRPDRADGYAPDAGSAVDLARGLLAS